MTTRKIIFIDSSIADYQELIESLPANSKWFLLKPDQDGIEQIQSALSNYNELESIQILSHGTQGILFLGNTILNQHNIDSYSNQLGNIGNSLAQSDYLLLYKQYVTQGGKEFPFVDQLSQLTCADVAVSIARPTPSNIS